MADITYEDKNKEAAVNSAPTLWRDVDANEVKNVAATKVDKEAGKSLVADTEILKIHAAGSDNQDLSGLVTLATEQTITAKKTIATDKLVTPDITSLDDFTIKTPANKTAVFSQVTYRDEYPAMTIPASGSAAPDAVGHTIGGVARTLYGFDGGATQEILSGSFEIPHDYKIGAAIEAHIHWRPSTSGTGTVKWYLDWEYSPPNAQPQSQTALSVINTLASDKQYFHILDTFGNLPQPSTPFAIGGKIGWNLRRTPADDTYGSDALLEQISLHVPCDTLGSRQIYVK
jgi:hypothetical protein